MELELLLSEVGHMTVLPPNNKEIRRLEKQIERLFNQVNEQQQRLVSLERTVESHLKPLSSEQLQENIQ